MTTKSNVHEFRVTFGGVSIGDGTCRIGLKVARDVIGLDEADRILCGRRLTGQIVATPGGESQDQLHLFDGVRPAVAGVFDVRRFAVNRREITAGLTFTLQQADLPSLAAFSGRQGVLQVEAVGDINDEESDEPEAGPHDVDADMVQRTSDADWRQLGLEHLRSLKTGQKTRLKKAGLTTIGKLFDAQKPGVEWFRGFRGIGQSIADAVSDAFVVFWGEHPEYTERLE